MLHCNMQSIYNLCQSVEDPHSEEFVLEVALDRRRQRLPGDGRNLQNKLLGTRVFDWLTDIVPSLNILLHIFFGTFGGQWAVLS